MPRIAQLGKALSILNTAYAREDAMHIDVSAFYAPSECHALVSRGADKRIRQARKHAEAVARAPYRVIVAQAIKRGRWNTERVQARAQAEAGVKFMRF